MHVHKKILILLLKKAINQFTCYIHTHIQITYGKLFELNKYYLFQIFHKFTYLQVLSLLLDFFR